MLTFLLAADADRTLAQRVGEGLVGLASLWPLWLPLLVGGAAFVSLRRGLNRPDRPDLCHAPVPTDIPTVSLPARGNV